MPSQENKVGEIRISVSADIDKSSDAKMKDAGKKAAKSWVESFINTAKSSVSGEQQKIMNMFSPKKEAFITSFEKKAGTGFTNRMFGQETFNNQNQSTGRQGGIFNKISESLRPLAKMVALIGLISLGIDAMWKLTKGIALTFARTSGFLMAMLKILSIAFTLFFKPFGDFLAALLRPAIMWLMKMAKDFTTKLMPLTKALIGGKISPIEFLKEAMKLMLPDMKKMGEKFKEAWEAIKPILQEAWEAIKPVLSVVWNDIVKPILTTAWGLVAPMIPDAVSAVLKVVIAVAPGIILGVVQGLAQTFIANILGGILGVVIGVIAAAAIGATGGLAIAIYVIFVTLGAVLFPIFVKAVESGVEILKGLGKWLWDKITGAIGSLTGGITNIIKGARQMGGSVGSNQSYLVGERGPELFTPSQAGNVTANNKLGSGGDTYNISVNITTSKLDQSNINDLARQVGEKIYTDVRRRVTF